VPLKEWQPQNERTPLVGDLIGSGELVLLYARPKAGKSILCANLVKGVAEGSTALGLPCRKGRVGVIALEDLAVWHERLTELEVNGDDVFVAPIPSTILDLPAIKQAITELQLALLVIDPLALFLRPLLQKERAAYRGITMRSTRRWERFAKSRSKQGAPSSWCTTKGKRALVPNPPKRQPSEAQPCQERLM